LFQMRKSIKLKPAHRRLWGIMINQKPGVHLAVGVAFFALALPTRSSAQSSDPCTDIRSQQAWDDGRSRVYEDATELARTLENRGFVVECIRRSVGEHLFESEKGSAWFKTDQGIFEVWFLPQAQNFALLNIISQEQDGRYIYTFRGTPRIATTIDSSKPISFVKHGNLLFEIWGDQQLAASLEQAFRNP
jgi:hypothetical protein